MGEAVVEVIARAAIIAGVVIAISVDHLAIQAAAVALAGIGGMILLNNGEIE